MTVRAYGQIKGLPERVANWVHRAKYDKTLPWVGCGLVSDMEAVVRLLSLEEFGQWLRQHPDDELQRWGAEVLDAARASAALVALIEDIDEVVPPKDDDEPPRNQIERAHHQIERAGEVRSVLVELGVLSADDTATSIPDLLRALLA